jgi:hypothetical protein
MVARLHLNHWLATVGVNVILPMVKNLKEKGPGPGLCWQKLRHDFQNNQSEGAEGIVQKLEHLPSKHEDLSLKISIAPPTLQEKKKMLEIVPLLSSQNGLNISFSPTFYHFLSFS